LLAAENYCAEACDSLDEVQLRGNGHARVVALVAWQCMEGLLAEEHRHRLVDLTQRLRLVLMVPRRWFGLLERTQLGTALAGIVAKPFEADDLLHTLEHALVSPVDA
jgi:hypothetical protein